MVVKDENNHKGRFTVQLQNKKTYSFPWGSRCILGFDGHEVFLYDKSSLSTLFAANFNSALKLQLVTIEHTM